MYLENVLNNSYYMNTSSLIKKEWREMLAGVSHVDNTTRMQERLRDSILLKGHKQKNTEGRAHLSRERPDSFERVSLPCLPTVDSRATTCACSLPFGNQSPN